MSTVEVIRSVLRRCLGMAMGLYSPFLSLGTSTDIGPSDVWTVLWYVPFLEPPEFFPDGSYLP